MSLYRRQKTTPTSTRKKEKKRKQSKTKTKNVKIKRKHPSQKQLRDQGNSRHPHRKTLERISRVWLDLKGLIFTEDDSTDLKR